MDTVSTGPIILSTWTFGQKANAAGWSILARGGSSLDAVEQGCRAVEADPENMTVGQGGYPDSSGEVTLDASIMVSPAQCGSVCYVKRHLHPVTIARRVMEDTPHVLLAGKGADRYAAGCGLESGEVTTDKSRAAWEKWRSENPEATRDVANHLPAKNIEEGLANDGAENLPHNRFHDTVGVLAIDAAGLIAGACSTSGWAFKMPGRVGDSPIIGHGLYVDPKHGAAVATGSGELLMGVCGSFLAVEMLRRGATPLDAACEVLHRIIDQYQLKENHQAAMIVLKPDGTWSSAALREGFSVAVRNAKFDELVEAELTLLS